MVKKENMLKSKEKAKPPGKGVKCEEVEAELSSEDSKSEYFYSSSIEDMGTVSYESSTEEENYKVNIEDDG
jgi:hypothetical protein